MAAKITREEKIEATKSALMNLHEFISTAISAGIHMGKDHVITQDQVNYYGKICGDLATSIVNNAQEEW